MGSFQPLSDRTSWPKGRRVTEHPGWREGEQPQKTRSNGNRGWAKFVWISHNQPCSFPGQDCECGVPNPPSHPAENLLPSWQAALSQYVLLIGSSNRALQSQLFPLCSRAGKAFCIFLWKMALKVSKIYCHHHLSFQAVKSCQWNPPKRLNALPKH